MTGQCKIEGCTNLAKYALYMTLEDGKKVWLHVCRTHEKIIGDDNMRRAGGYISQKQLDEIRRSKQ